MGKLISFCVILCTLFSMGCEHTTSEILHKAHELDEMTVKIGEQSWSVEVAKTQEQRQQGLMLRESLSEGNGMLFIFEEIDFHSFWMKNTLIPLDVIWISENMKVVDIQTLTPCESEECPSFVPSVKASYVLEVSAGSFEGIVGDSVLLK